MGELNSKLHRGKVNCKVIEKVFSTLVRVVLVIRLITSVDYRIMDTVFTIYDIIVGSIKYNPHYINLTLFIKPLSYF